MRPGFRFAPSGLRLTTADPWCRKLTIKHISGNGLRASRGKLWARLCSHDAETISKWIATKCDRRAGTAFEFLLAFGASLHCHCQEGFKIVDVKVDVNWR